MDAIEGSLQGGTVIAVPFYFIAHGAYRIKKDEVTMHTEVTRKVSCISDRPVIDKEGDKLKNSTYVDGLFQFILNADTPVTIGIQGGWGSGKTSLINMLKERLDAPEANTLCVFVNAWEHSLFQAVGGKAEITLSLLRGLVEGMTDTVKKAIAAGKVYDNPNEPVLGENGLSRKVMKGVAEFALAAAALTAQATARSLLGVTFATPSSKTTEESVPPAKTIRGLREDLGKVITAVTKGEKNPKRFVFFIDDLDRVPPETAVEILDATKNIFDIENCIFVLAVDYDVVVKGLKSKFGEKEKTNEREFRQYFDKIIQIPFTMPVGAYEKELKQLLIRCFDSIGYSFDEGDDELKNICRVASDATDGIPRSIKRIVNTLSLLQCISRAGQEYAVAEDEAAGDKSELDDAIKNELEIRFIIVSLHINFPELCRRLMENHDFTRWTLKDLSNRWRLKIENDYFKRLQEDYGKTFDTEWQRVVHCLCLDDDWLKSRDMAIANIFTALRVALMRHSKKGEC
jgi:hypothetical protein